MTYARMLRALVGHIPLELPGTGIIIFREDDGKNLFLLQHRADNDRFGLFGGGIELDETYRQCANRELYEEAGLFACEDDFVLLDVYAGKRHITEYPNGDVVYHTVVVYSIDYKLCSFDRGDLDQETKELVWFDKDGIETLLKENRVFPNNAPILEDLINGKFQL